MSKFNVGDKVKRVRDEITSVAYVPVGTEFVITHIGDVGDVLGRSGWYARDDDEACNGVYFFDLELVDEEVSTEPEGVWVLTDPDYQELISVVYANELDALRAGNGKLGEVRFAEFGKPLT